jgi:hypothetical protein
MDGRLDQPRRRDAWKAHTFRSAGWEVLSRLPRREAERAMWDAQSMLQDRISAPLRVAANLRSRRFCDLLPLHHFADTTQYCGTFRAAGAGSLYYRTTHDSSRITKRRNCRHSIAGIWSLAPRLRHAALWNDGSAANHAIGAASRTRRR